MKYYVNLCTSNLETLFADAELSEAEQTSEQTEEHKIVLRNERQIPVIQ